MKFKKQTVLLSLAFTLSGSIAVLYMNASRERQCSESNLCKNVLRAMRNAPERLNAEELSQHMISRFGFGVSPADTQTIPRGANMQLVEKLAMAIVEPIERGHVYMTPELNRLASQYNYQLPNSRIIINPVTESPRELFRKYTRLNTILANSPENLAHDRAVARYHTRATSAGFRMMMNALGSQKRVGNSISDSQVNFSHLLGDFWFNHFNVDMYKPRLAGGLGQGSYDRTIFENMNGTFYQMLSSVIHHEAMIEYLDNQSNIFLPATRAASNQNLGRELMELHTLGEGPGRLYQQVDVQNSALLLAGLGVDAITRAPSMQAAGFLNQDFITPQGQREVQVAPVIMGNRYCLIARRDVSANQQCAKPATGQTISAEQRRVMADDRLNRYLRFLASHPRTQRNICGKLTRRFVRGYMIDEGQPTEERVVPVIVDRCMAAWGAQGNLKAMYISILTSPELWSRQNFRTYRKNPVELVTSAVRATGLTTAQLSGARLELAKNLSAMQYNQSEYLGLRYRGHVPPTGYKETYGWQTQGLLVRWLNSSFRIGNFYESFTNDTYSPLMAISPRRGIASSNESDIAELQSAQAREQFVKDLMGITRSVETPGMDARLRSIVAPGAEGKLVVQNVNGRRERVVLKTAALVKTSDFDFLRK